MRAGIFVAAALALLAQGARAEQTFHRRAENGGRREGGVRYRRKRQCRAGARAPSRHGGGTRKEGDADQAGAGGRHHRRREARAADEVARRAVSGLEAQFAQRKPISPAPKTCSRAAPCRRRRRSTRRAPSNVASNALKARTSRTLVIQQQVTEGKVLAPTAGRVLKVPVEAAGTVVARRDRGHGGGAEFHPAAARAGAACALSQSRRYGAHRRRRASRQQHQLAPIRLVYPQIEDGRVIADAAVAGLGDYLWRAHPRVVLGRRAGRHHRAGRLVVHAFRHRLCARAQGRAAQ